MGDSVGEGSHRGRKEDARKNTKKEGERERQTEERRMRERTPHGSLHIHIMFKPETPVLGFGRTLTSRKGMHPGA